MAVTMKPNPTGNYIKEITLPSGTAYEIVDENARGEINTMSTSITNMSTTISSISSNVNSLSSTVNSMSKYTSFLGVSSTTLVDGSTTSSIMVGSTTIAATTGAIAIYKPADSNAQEYIWDGSKWQFFGDISATNLGTLAYKSSISAQYIKPTGATTTGTATKTSTGKFTPAGTVSVSGTTTAYVKISSTTTAPSNTSNYWVYTPGGTVTAAAGISGGTKTAAFTSITQQTVVTTATTGAPSSTTAGTLMYAQVTDHSLKLNQIKPTTGNAISASATTEIVKTVGTISASATFNGETIYAERKSVTVPDTFKFEGTQGDVSVTGTFVNTVTVTTASAYATITYPS